MYLFDARLTVFIEINSDSIGMYVHMFGRRRVFCFFDKYKCSVRTQAHICHRRALWIRPYMGECVMLCGTATTDIDAQVDSELMGLRVQWTQKNGRFMTRSNKFALPTVGLSPLNQQQFPYHPHTQLAESD